MNFFYGFLSWDARGVLKPVLLYFTSYSDFVSVVIYCRRRIRIFRLFRADLYSNQINNYYVGLKLRANFCNNINNYILGYRVRGSHIGLSWYSKLFRGC